MQKTFLGKSSFKEYTIYFLGLEKLKIFTKNITGKVEDHSMTIHDIQWIYLQLYLKTFKQWSGIFQKLSQMSSPSTSANAGIISNVGTEIWYQIISSLK